VQSRAVSQRFVGGRCRKACAGAPPSFVVLFCTDAARCKRQRYGGTKLLLPQELRNSLPSRPCNPHALAVAQAISCGHSEPRENSRVCRTKKIATRAVCARINC